MITYEQYAEQFAKENGYGGHETLFRCGLSGAELEEFTKGYGKLVAEAQKEQDIDQSTGESRYFIRHYSPIIELI